MLARGVLKHPIPEVDHFVGDIGLLRLIVVIEVPRKVADEEAHRNQRQDKRAEDAQGFGFACEGVLGHEPSLVGEVGEEARDSNRHAFCHINSMHPKSLELRVVIK